MEISPVTGLEDSYGAKQQQVGENLMRTPWRPWRQDPSGHRSQAHFTDIPVKSLSKWKLNQDKFYNLT